MAHWHGLAKLRMHSDLTLDIMDQVTSAVGQQFRKFKATVCSMYDTHELHQEVQARTRRLAKQKGGQKGKRTTSLLERGEAVGTGDVIKKAQRQKGFNFQTYKFHALGDYVSTIRQYGTVDSYSTEPVSAVILNSRPDLLTSLG